MPEDLPSYPDNVILRSGLEFADLQRWRNVDISPILAKSDTFIALMEGAGNVDQARAALAEPNKEALLRAHRILFSGQPGAGELRQTLIAGRYPGQDCPEPQFIY